MNDLSKMGLRQLLGQHASIMAELRHRGVLYNGSNLTAELAGFLFCAAYGWQEVPSSEKGFSAVDVDGIRYLIRGRRLGPWNRSRQLSTIRDLGGFDILAAVLLDDAYRVFRAALIPSAVVLDRRRFVRKTNGQGFTLSRDVWRDARVADATGRLRAVEAQGRGWPASVGSAGLPARETC